MSNSQKELNESELPEEVQETLRVQRERFSIAMLKVNRDHVFFRKILDYIPVEENIRFPYMMWVSYNPNSSVGISLGYNPLMMGEITDNRSVRGILIHEVLHIVLKHHERRVFVKNWCLSNGKTFDADIINVGNDAAINSMIIEMDKTSKKKLNLDPGSWFYENGVHPFGDPSEDYNWMVNAVKGMAGSLASEEYIKAIYDAFPEAPESEPDEKGDDSDSESKPDEDQESKDDGKGSGGGEKPDEKDESEDSSEGDGEGDGEDSEDEGKSNSGSGDSDSEDEEDSEGGSSPSSKGATGPSKGMPKAMSDHSWIDDHDNEGGEDAPEQGMSELQKSLLDSRIREALNDKEVQKEIGSTPLGAMIDSLYPLGTTNYKWEDMFKRALRSGKFLEKKMTLKRQVRRWSGIPDEIIPVKFPSKTRVRDYSIVMIVDTSGSMSKDDLTKAAEVILSLKVHKPNLKLRILEWDCALQRDYEVSTIRDVHEKSGRFSGGGGTEFHEAITFGKETYDPDCMVYCTDGYGNAGDGKVLKKTKMIWMITPDGKLPCHWGAHVLMQPSKPKRLTK